MLLKLKVTGSHVHSKSGNNHGHDAR